MIRTLFNLVETPIFIFLVFEYKIHNQHPGHYAKYETLNIFPFELASGMSRSHVILAFYSKNPAHKQYKFGEVCAKDSI